MAYHDDDDDRDPEEPDSVDMADDDEDDQDLLNPCPNCRRMMYDDAEQCPHCGHYLSAETDRGRNPLWIVLTALVCLAAALAWLF